MLWDHLAGFCVESIIFKGVSRTATPIACRGKHDLNGTRFDKYIGASFKIDANITKTNVNPFLSFAVWDLTVVDKSRLRALMLPIG